MSSPANPSALSQAQVTRYRIRDASGAFVAIHCRQDGPDGKRMWWEQPNGTSGLGGLSSADLPLYGIDRLTGSPTVVLVEGEKAAEALIAAGIQAVGTVTGASATPGAIPLAELSGRRVRLWPDNDDVGRTHMQRIGAALAGIAAEVRVIAWSDASEHGDAADFIAADGAREAVQALIEGASPLPAGFRSAHSSTSSGDERMLPFRTARAVAQEVPEKIDWFVLGYIAAGAVTELVGKIKAAGKTTWVTHAVRAIVTGTPFMDRPTTRTGVAYLTEQSSTSFRVALARAGLLEREDVGLLFWRDVAGVPWPKVVAGAVAECRRRGYGVLVVDTLPRFAGLRGDAENNAGDADGAMAPLQLAAADGLAVVVVRHERKAGGEVGDSGRGSSAFGGAVDIVLALKRGEGATRPTVRVLHALSRFDETPSELIVELGDEGYVALGDRAAVAQTDARARLLADLPHSSEAALSMDEIEERFAGLSASTIERARDDLVAQGDVLRRGKGRKGDPYRYWRFMPGEEDGIHSAPLEDEFGQNEIPIEEDYPRSAWDPDAGDDDPEAEDRLAAHVPEPDLVGAS